MGQDFEIHELNIQPQAGVIGVFSRLNYKPWYAIAEFVDNSTQSFYSHQEKLAENGVAKVGMINRKPNTGSSGKPFAPLYETFTVILPSPVTQYFTVTVVEGIVTVS